MTKITFNTNGTGTYTAETGTTYTTTWQFLTADERNMRLIVNTTSSPTFTWNLLEITSGAFHHISSVGTNILISARYKPM